MLETADIKKAVIRSQHCQRNFDLSKEMPQEDLDLLIYSATNCPSKQNHNFYNLHVIKDRQIIEKIHELSPGASALNKETGEQERCTNSQVLANVIFVFEQKSLKDMSSTYHRKLSEYEDYDCYVRDVHTSIGIAAGYINLTASLLYYSTGCCQCFDTDAIQNYLKLDYKPLLIMGIGYKNQNQNRRVHPVNKNLIFSTRKKEPISVKIT